MARPWWGCARIGSYSVQLVIVSLCNVPDIEQTVCGWAHPIWLGRARPAYPIAADAVEYWTHKLSLGLPEDTDLLSTDWFQRHARSGAGRALQDWCSGSQLDASDVYWSFVSDMVQRYKLGSGVQRPGSVPCWAKLSRDRCGWSTSHIIPSVSPFQVRCETVHAKLGCKKHPYVCIVS